MFWGSILSPRSPFLAFPHLQFWRMGVYGFWGGLCLSPFGDPSHCYWFPTFQFCHFGHLVSQSIFSPLASFVPRAQPNQAAFWCWDYLIKTIHVQGPFRRVYQLNPTDFLLPKHSSIHFLNLENFCLGFGGNLLLLNSFLLCFHHFLDLTINGHISLLGMLGVPLSTVNL